MSQFFYIVQFSNTNSETWSWQWANTGFDNDKVKLSVWLIKHHNTETYWGAKAQRQSLLTSALDEGEWSNPRPGYITLVSELPPPPALNSRLGGHYSRPGKEKKYLVLLRALYWPLGGPVRGPATVPTELPSSLFSNAAVITQGTPFCINASLSGSFGVLVHHSLPSCCECLSACSVWTAEGCCRCFHFPSPNSKLNFPGASLNIVKPWPIIVFMSLKHVAPFMRLRRTALN